MDWLEANGFLTRERRYRDDGYRTSDIIVIHQEPFIQEKTLAATVSPNILAATQSNLSGHSVLSEPVIEPVNYNNKTRAREKTQKTPIPDVLDLNKTNVDLMENLQITKTEQINQFQIMKDWAVNAGPKAKKHDWQAFYRNWFKSYALKRKTQNAKPTQNSKSRFTSAANELRESLGLGEDHESPRYDSQAGP
jgi:hypothetical protein